jgi:hypothetical protein
MTLRPYNEQTGLDLVTAYFAERGLAAERFSRAETLAGKTPDFRVRQEGTVVAYCEVKAPNDPWLNKLLDEARRRPSWAVPGRIPPLTGWLGFLLKLTRNSRRLIRRALS